MTAAPPPLVPPDVDLNGFDFMPLYGEMLRTSDFNGQANDAEFRAGFNLWWAAWLQVPAASLPNIEGSLCKAAGLGGDLRRWRKVRDHAMRGFILCSDGRWYHRFLAPKAIEAWKERLAAIKRGKASGVARKLRKSSSNQSQDVKAFEERVETISKLSRDEIKTETNKGTGDRGEPSTTASTVETGTEHQPTAATAVPPEPHTNPEAAAKIIAECTRAGIQHPDQDNVVARWIRTGATPSQVAKALAEAPFGRDAPKPMTSGYANAVLERVMANDAKAHQQADKRTQATQDLIAEQRARPAPGPIPDSALPDKLRRAIRKPDDFETLGT